MKITINSLAFCLLLGACTTKNKINTELETLQLSASEVVDIAQKHLISMEFDLNDYYISHPPSYHRSTDSWMVIFEEKGDTLELRTSTYGVAINDKNSNDILLLPGL